jgi:hypothetical protein
LELCKVYERKSHHQDQEGELRVIMKAYVPQFADDTIILDTIILNSLSYSRGDVDEYWLYMYDTKVGDSEWWSNWKLLPNQDKYISDIQFAKMMYL